MAGLLQLLFLTSSRSENSSQVHENTPHGCTFKGALCPDWVFLHDFAGVCCCAPPPHVFLSNEQSLSDQAA